METQSAHPYPQCAACPSYARLYPPCCSCVCSCPCLPLQRYTIQSRGKCLRGRGRGRTPCVSYARPARACNQHTYICTGVGWLDSRPRNVEARPSHKPSQAKPRPIMTTWTLGGVAARSPRATRVAGGNGQTGLWTVRCDGAHSWRLAHGRSPARPTVTTALHHPNTHTDVLVLYSVLCTLYTTLHYCTYSN